MYQIENPIGRAIKAMDGAASTTKSMMKDVQPKKPGPTVGGGIMAGAGGAVMGAQAGSLLATPAAIKAGGTLAAIGGPIPMALGAAVGIGAYLFT